MEENSFRTRKIGRRFESKFVFEPDALLAIPIIESLATTLPRPLRILDVGGTNLF
jgi:hypothetical protein